jgi:hypothetical protein
MFTGKCNEPTIALSQGNASRFEEDDDRFLNGGLVHNDRLLNNDGIFLTTIHHFLVYGHGAKYD